MAKAKKRMTPKRKPTKMDKVDFAQTGRRKKNADMMREKRRKK